MKKLLSIILTLLLVFTLVGCSEADIHVIQSALNNFESAIDQFESQYNELDDPTAQVYGPYTVVNVVDGDTIDVDINGDTVRVRMIGIDTPESVHSDNDKNTTQGDIASNYTKSCLTNTSVYLEYDTDKKDDYGRTLAYVYVNGKMFNKTLLEKGYAKTMTIPPNVKYREKFAEIEKTAKNNDTGFWDGFFD